jgi:hypothetical protein
MICQVNSVPATAMLLGGYGLCLGLVGALRTSSTVCA